MGSAVEMEGKNAFAILFIDTEKEKERGKKKQGGEKRSALSDQKKPCCEKKSTRIVFEVLRSYIVSFLKFFFI